MYEKLTLPNGVRIVTEHIDHMRSASLGIWVGSGSRFEPAGRNGISHFIEHMLFKGTETRSAEELAAMMDAVGGQTNAFTAKECTVFYGRVLDSHLARLEDMLFDMFFCSRFDEGDVLNERGVVFEEIDMYRDTPEDLVSERLFYECFRGSGLARPILGTKATLKRMTGQGMREYMLSHYIPQRVVIALAGSFSDRDVRDVAERFSAMVPGREKPVRAAEYTPVFTAKRKAIEQNHLCLGFPGISRSDPDRYAMSLFSSILGGGMSSRLFQQVREKNGLCYSVYTFVSSYSDIGTFNIYAGVGEETEEKALRLILSELERIRQDGVTADELSRAREQVKSNMVMELESTGAHMNRLGKSELLFGEVPDTDEVIAAYDAVTAEEIRAVAQKVLDLTRVSLSAVGRVRDADRYRELMGSEKS